MPRDLKTLLADNETPATIQSALDALDELVPTSTKWESDIAALRHELSQELHAIGGQGSLF